jgi:hypothetical protein
MDTQTQWGIILFIACAVAFGWRVEIEPRTRKRVFWIRFKRAAIVYLAAFIIAIVLGLLKGMLGL